MCNMALLRLAYAAHQQPKTEMSIESHTEMISDGNEAEIAAILIEAANDLHCFPKSSLFILFSSIILRATGGRESCCQSSVQQ